MDDEVATAERKETDVSSDGPRNTSYSSFQAAIVDGEVSQEKEQKDICRICHNPGSTENPLRYPCACRGLSNLSTRSVFFAGSNVARFPAARFASTHSCLSLCMIRMLLKDFLSKSLYLGLL